MNPQDVETVYEALAAAIDEAGPQRAELYLAKLALLLAVRLDDPAAALDAIAEAGADLG